MIDRSLFATSSNPGLEHAVNDFRMQTPQSFQGASTNVFLALLDQRNSPRVDIVGNKTLSGRNMTEKIVRATYAMQSALVRIRGESRDNLTFIKDDRVLDETMIEIQELFSIF